MDGKAEGIVSDELNNLRKQEAKLRKDALSGVIDYYSAPDGQAGEAQRTKADEIVQDVWREQNAIAARISELEGSITNAILSKNDLGRWLKMI